MKKELLIKEIGATIHKIRQRKHLTIQYVAKASRISISMLSNLENLTYVSLPTYPVLKRIADALGIQRKRLVCLVTRETGRRIQALRNEKRQNQVIFAENIRKSRDVVSNWERGQVIVPPRWINNLAQYFHVRPFYLLCQSDQKRLKPANHTKSHSEISLFSCKTKPESEVHVVNPLCFVLDSAIDKDIPVMYHGVKLSKSRWNICSQLVKDWYKHEGK